MPHHNPAFKILVGGMRVLAALFIDWSIVKGTLFGIPFSFAALAVLFWFWEISLSGRLWISFFFGIFMDTFSLLPFGTYTALFFILSFFVEFLHSFFFSVHTSIARVAAVTLSWIAFTILAYAASALPRLAEMV